MTKKALDHLIHLGIPPVIFSPEKIWLLKQKDDNWVLAISEPTPTLKKDLSIREILEFKLTSTSFPWKEKGTHCAPFFLFLPIFRLMEADFAVIKAHSGFTRNNIYPFAPYGIHLIHHFSQQIADGHFRGRFGFPYIKIAFKSSAFGVGFWDGKIRKRPFSKLSQAIFTSVSYSAKTKKATDVSRLPDKMPNWPREGGKWGNNLVPKVSEGAIIPTNVPAFFWKKRGNPATAVFWTRTAKKRP